MKIAAVLTCHNRKDKTISCLECLYNALDYYNQDGETLIDLTAFITDDGCTDGTVEAIYSKFSGRKIRIIKGDGQLFWAGGMRLAWGEAVKVGYNYDFYLLLNDDTIVYKDCFKELLKTNDYSLKKYKREGLYSGITCSLDDLKEITYGGSIWTSRLLAKSKLLEPSGEPQLCDMANANILLVSKDVVNEIGILYKGYRHAEADYDYSINARKKKFPVLVTSSVCGKCNDDHGSREDNGRKICAMSFRERISFFRNPLHSNGDYLLFIRRNAPLRYPIVFVGRCLNIVSPHIYYRFLKKVVFLYLLCII